MRKISTQEHIKNTNSTGHFPKTYYSEYVFDLLGSQAGEARNTSSYYAQTSVRNTHKHMVLHTQKYFSLKTRNLCHGANEFY